MADALENWIDLTDIVNVRRNVPDLPALPKLGENPSEEEVIQRERIIKERNQIVRQAAIKNAFTIFRSAFKTYPEETLEVLAYSCFIPLDKIDDYKMTDLMRSVTEMLSDEDVLDFFVSFKEMGQRIGT